MREMSRRERILTTIQGKRADKIPFFHLWRRLQTGEEERKARNKCMGVWWERPCYIESYPSIDIVEYKGHSSGLNTSLVEYRTPVGVVSERLRKERGVGQWKAQRSWKDIIPWAAERRIKKPEDYKTVKSIVEDTIYEADYFPIKQAKKWLGDDGVVITPLPHSPMQMLMIDWVGTPTFFIHYFKHKNKVESLYKSLSERYMEIYKIAAESPADAVRFGDNLDGVLVPPRLFKKYFIPEYEKCAKLVHENGKKLISHFDGRLNTLKDLIAQCPIDVIEAFHPPPMGDLPLHEALDLWKDKVILIGFPGSIYSLGNESVRKFLLSLLKQILPGDRVALEASTENLVTDSQLRILSSVMDKVSIPLTKSQIMEIEKIQKNLL